MNSRRTAILLSLFLLPTLLHARAEGHFDKTLQVNGAVSLDVMTGSGDIVVKTGSPNQMVVHGSPQQQLAVRRRQRDSPGGIESSDPAKRQQYSHRL